MGLKLAPGYAFFPTDEELLTYYLKPKICGGKLSRYIIQEKEIYGPNKNPWEVFDELSTSWIISDKSEKIAYAYVKLTNIAVSCTSTNGTRKDRKAGCGTWHNGTGPKKIMDSAGKNIIGYKRMFVFGINDFSSLGDLSKFGYWKMHEYSLRGHENYVVCRITFDDSKNVKVVDKKAVNVAGLRGSEDEIVAPMPYQNIIHDNQRCLEDNNQMLVDENHLALAWSDKEFDENMTALTWSEKEIDDFLAEVLFNENMSDNDNQVLGKRKLSQTHEHIGLKDNRYLNQDPMKKLCI